LEEINPVEPAVLRHALESGGHALTIALIAACALGVVRALGSLLRAPDQRLPDKLPLTVTSTRVGEGPEK
jgi:hypothetical protein